MGPHHAASQQSGTSTEAQHQEAVRVDETDDEGRHLTGQQGQEAGKLTGCAAFPLNVFPHVVALIQLVHHTDHGKVHAH